MRTHTKTTKMIDPVCGMEVDPSTAAAVAGEFGCRIFSNLEDLADEIQAAVVAVPTSVGYGASFGGLAALLGMLNSCASNVTVVNIDNGFGAACAAARIINSSHQVLSRDG